MRCLRVAACVAAVLCAPVSLAAAAENLSCASQALAAADEWSAGRIVPVDDTAMMEPDRVIVISYGHKYSVPRRGFDDPNLRQKPLGQLAIERNRVYYDELNRCLGRLTLRPARGHAWVYIVEPATGW